MKLLTALFSTLLLTLTAHGQSCEALSSLSLPNATISQAQQIPTGTFSIPGTNSTIPDLPAFCRVSATLRPTPDSEIRMEVWLPTTNWNGKFEAVGNGGLAGTITYSWLAAALQEGYATASTDTGHTGPTASFAIGHPEKVIDFAYRSVHEMTLQSKTIIAAFYHRPLRYSYFTGCSTGGRQGLMEAQRYPDDFDGIIAGAPANNQAHLGAWRINVESKILQNPASVVPPDKLAVLHRAVLTACDALDGVTDGLLSDPLQCHFDPATLLCHDATTSHNDCLTQQQIDAVKMAYAPATRANGELIFPGLVPGGETGWDMLTAAKAEPGSIDVGLFRFLAHEDPAWDWRSFNLDRDTSLLDSKAGFIDALNPDLSAFHAHGGKLLLYHGWSDGGSGGAISPLNTINYYESVLAKMGPSQQDWFRLFLVPGMAHCGGGPGLNQVNWMASLERWRESQIPPDRIPASRVTDNHVNMTRPLCPYPAAARYTGTGTTNDAANFTCTLP